MRYKQFYPGDKVITIVDYGGVPSGTIGSIASRWAGTVYLIRSADGTYRWLGDKSLAPADANSYTIREGDMGVVTSDLRQNFAKVGDRYQVHKVVYDMDYYGVLIGDELKWLGGIQLAAHSPAPKAP